MRLVVKFILFLAGFGLFLVGIAHHDAYGIAFAAAVLAMGGYCYD